MTILTVREQLFYDLARRGVATLEGLHQALVDVQQTLAAPAPPVAPDPGDRVAGALRWVLVLTSAADGDVTVSIHPTHDRAVQALRDECATLVAHYGYDAPAAAATEHDLVAWLQAQHEDTASIVAAYDETLLADTAPDPGDPDDDALPPLTPGQEALLAQITVRQADPAPAIPASVIALAQALATFPWLTSDPIRGSDLIEAIMPHLDLALGDLAAAGVALDPTWQRRDDESEADDDLL